jgi:hypothetical protein
MDYGRVPDEQLVRRFREEWNVLAFEAIPEKYSQPIHNCTLRLLATRKLWRGGGGAPSLRIWEVRLRGLQISGQPMPSGI